MFGADGEYSKVIGFIGTMDTVQTCLQMDALVNERQIYTYATGSNAIGKLVFNLENITTIEMEGYTYGSSNYPLTSVLSPNKYPRP
jgi:hypothetical protein